MLIDCEGDILKSDASALVNPVNCVGVMGKGLARQFRDQFPDNYRVYRDACDRGEVKPGTVFPVLLAPSMTITLLGLSDCNIL